MFSHQQDTLLKQAAHAKAKEYHTRSSYSKKQTIAKTDQSTTTSSDDDQTTSTTSQQQESTGSLQSSSHSNQCSSNTDIRVPKRHKSIYKTGLRKRSNTLRRSAKSITAEGHRGAGILKFENTIAAFSRAIEVGLASVELDVWFTKDNQVVHGDEHDMIELIDGSKRIIGSLTYEETRELVRLPNGETMPLLREVLILCKGKVHVNVEIKGKEDELTAAVIDLIIEHGMIEQVHLSSFQHSHATALANALELRGLGAGAVSFGYLVWKQDELDALEKVLDAHKQVGRCIVAFPVEFIYDPLALEYLLRAKNKGATLSCYFDFDVIENELIYERLTSVGVSTIITNQPNSLLRYTKRI